MLPLIFAFCGFYVSGSGAKLSNDATEVVLMRDGTRTVLSMQNDYRGPLEDFAMVVPVPVVLHEGDVQTLEDEVFEHVDALGAPRLVEYWEQDPCPADYGIGDGVGYGMLGSVAYGGGIGYGMGAGGVTVEATFDVAEYQIVILSATDSAGLETWLTDNHYKIPAGAEPLLRPYVEAGMKFFVAKVNPAKVEMDHGHAALSPLRFDYDSEEFALPIRLGMANSAGKQDLIVNILSRDKRYEVANYKNVFIPTNIDVKPSVKARFSEFYAALFDKTIEKNPGAVVTEYAWTATRSYHCDPCPDLDVTTDDITQLGGDIIGGDIQNNFVLTRLHARYGKKDMKDDLVFREATPVTGGREEWSKAGLEYGATPSEKNFFQGRYAIRHAWSGPIKCKHPQRYVWGASPDGNDSETLAASKLAFVPRGKLDLSSVIGRDLWEIGYKKARKGPSTRTKAMGGGALLLLGLGAFLLRRRRP
jgi:MYXO-CTERM domain-containing protein